MVVSLQVDTVFLMYALDTRYRFEFFFFVEALLYETSCSL